MVTGATGFVGAHTTHALLQAGHEVTALVRDRERLRDALAALGSDPPEHVVGDMTDATAVDRALEAADAVVHSAAVVSLDARREAEMVATNLAGMRTVVGRAVELGIDPVIYVSSTSALFRPGVGRLHPDLPVPEARHGYGRSKAECELFARRLQREGAPVAITYPGGILGPAAGASLGETAAGVSQFVAAGVVPTRWGALSLIDVRDLAAAHVALLEPGRGPRRVMCGGHLMTLEELTAALRELTGRRILIAPVPPVALRAAGQAVDAVRRLIPFETAMTGEGMELVTQWQGTDDRTLHELGIEPRDGRDTLRASLQAWHERGLLSTRQLGAPATGVGPSTRERVRSVKVPGAVLASTPFRRVAPYVIPPAHRFVLRLTGGRTMLDSEAQPMLMLTATGAKSGQPRQTPLAAVPRPDGTFVVVGSNFARETHPAWTANLLAHPDALVTFRGDTFPVTARLLTGQERDAIWPEIVQWYPNWDDYTRVTSREFRVFELAPTATP